MANGLLEVAEVGKIVMFRDGGQDMPAIITYVWTKKVVNVMAFDELAGAVLHTSVEFDKTPGEKRWRWLP